MTLKKVEGVDTTFLRILVTLTFFAFPLTLLAYIWYGDTRLLWTAGLQFCFFWFGAWFLSL